MSEQERVCVCSIGRQWQRTQNWSPGESFSLGFRHSASLSVQSFTDQATYFYGYTGIIDHSSGKNPTRDQQVSMLTSSCCLQSCLLNEREKNWELSSALVLMRGQTGWSKHCSPRCATPGSVTSGNSCFSWVKLHKPAAGLALLSGHSPLSSILEGNWENSAGAVLTSLKEGFAFVFSDSFGFMQEFNRYMWVYKKPSVSKHKSLFH